jgi:hypothetical protein
MSKCLFDLACLLRGLSQDFCWDISAHACPAVPFGPESGDQKTGPE